MMRGQKLNNGARDFMRFRSMAEHVDYGDEDTVGLFDNKANVAGRRVAEERPDSYAVFVGFAPGRQPFSNCRPGSAVRVRYQYEFIHHALYAGQTQTQTISLTPVIGESLVHVLNTRPLVFNNRFQAATTLSFDELKQNFSKPRVADCIGRKFGHSRTDAEFIGLAKPHLSGHPARGHHRHGDGLAHRRVLPELAAIYPDGFILTLRDRENSAEPCSRAQGASRRNRCANARVRDPFPQ